MKLSIYLINRYIFHIVFYYKYVDVKNSGFFSNALHYNGQAQNKNLQIL